MSPTSGRYEQLRSRCGFTLVELLIAIAIVLLLISVLLPSVNRARREAKLVQCASNMRQLCQGMLIYAAEHRNRFPPNVFFPSPGQLWYDAERVGGILEPCGIRKGDIFSCPEDLGALRSYSMNAWMSSKLDSWVWRQNPIPGRQWGAAPRQGCNVILLIESWSMVGNDRDGWTSAAIVGYAGARPGERFGAGGGLVPMNGGRWGLVNCEVDFRRHRPPGSRARFNEPIGAVNIAYADGHVALKSSDQLADYDSGRSTLDSLWSPLDVEQNR
jgi:prepilin-type N-terminal cleavage/methylation domain-containing protein/prepilin-type processing-associated H-X9-DG protein